MVFLQLRGVHLAGIQKSSPSQVLPSLLQDRVATAVCLCPSPIRATGKAACQSHSLNHPQVVVLGTQNTFVKFTVPLSLGVTKSKTYKGRGLHKGASGPGRGLEPSRVPERGEMHSYLEAASSRKVKGAMHNRWAWLQLPDLHIIQVTRIWDFFVV